jgi:RNA polymerase sigma-70 factor, ECF subfamily
MISRMIKNPAVRSVRPAPDDVSNFVEGESAQRCRLEEYSGYVHYLVRQHYPPHLAAKVGLDDIVQDILLKVWVSHPDFNGRSEEERLSFLRKTCSSVLIDTIRRYKRGKRKVALDQSIDDSSARLPEWLAAIQSSPSQRASKHEQLLRLAQALSGLPESQRRAVELRHLKRQSLAETAQSMGVSPQAAAGLLRRGLGTLRERLGAAGATLKGRRDERRNALASTR